MGLKVFEIQKNERQIKIKQLHESWEAEVEFGFTEEQEEFRQEIRDFCEKTPYGELVDPNKSSPYYSPSFYRKLAEKGWLGLPIPKEYGGLGLDFIWQTIFSEEMTYCLAPIPLFYIGAAYLFGPICLKHGSEQMKKKYLPGIAKGEIWFGQSFTEPEAGSDLASVQTRAIAKGDYYVINGQKTFNSAAHISDERSLLMARTDPNAPKEKGISLFILEHSTPGVTVIPLWAMGDFRTNQVFLDNVKIPRQNLVGEENRGWDYFTEIKPVWLNLPLGMEVGATQRTFDDIVQYTRETKRGGQLLSQNSLVRQKLAQAAIDIKVMRLLTYRLGWMVTKGLDALPVSTILLIIKNEATVRFINMAMQILGLHGQLQMGAKYAPLGGVIEYLYRFDAVRLFGRGGGSVARNFIATQVLGLPEF